MASEYYDTADPFIDDSELAVDERQYFAQTKQQGFYVSSGEVALMKDRYGLIFHSAIRPMYVTEHPKSPSRNGRLCYLDSVLRLARKPSLPPSEKPAHPSPTEHAMPQSPSTKTIRSRHPSSCTKLAMARRCDIRLPFCSWGRYPRSARGRQL